MSEIKVTKLINLGGFADFSASCAERGENAGAETWENAVNEARQHRILKPAQREQFRDFMKGFGAWDDEHIAAWTAYECDALLVQMVAGDMREMENLCPGDGLGGVDWDEAQRLSEQGTISGRLFVSGEDVYFSID